MINKTSILISLVLGMSVAATSYAADRKDFGFGGDGGGNLEAYSKDFSDPVKKGGFVFVYGGTADVGSIQFRHYDGSGWQIKMLLDHNGSLVIGNGSKKCSTCKLSVDGKIQAEEVVVSTTWADYVFRDNYELMKLDDVSNYITENGHLPGIPSAGQVKQDGINIGSMNKKMMAKIEELTLYVIALDNENKKLKMRLDQANIK